MKAPDFPVTERERQAAVDALNLLDTTAEERFDRFTRIARSALNVPIAVVSLVDGNRVWFKSCQGLDVIEVPRSISFCGHTILEKDFFLIPDTLKDERFFDSPMVTGPPHIRFYVGSPLISSDGNCVGTLCMLDTKPRNLSDDDLQVLRDLTLAVEEEIQIVGKAAVYDSVNTNQFLINENVKRLEEFESRFYDLTVGSLQGTLVTIGDRIEFANAALANLLGYTADELLQKPSWVDIIAPEDRERVLGYCKNRASNRDAPARYEYRGLKKDGSTIWLENLSTKVVWNGQPAVQAAIVDISARRDVEAKLIEGEERFRHFAEASSDWFWEMDEDLRYTWFSERVEDFTNFPREWHYGKTREELGIPDDQQELWAEHLELLKNRQPYRDFIYKRQAPDGIRWVRSSGIPIFDTDGQFKGYRGSGNEMTKDMEAREAASRANSLLKSAIDGLAEAFALWDPDDRLLIFNNKFLYYNRAIETSIKVGMSFEEFTRTALGQGIYAEASKSKEKWFQERIQMHKDPIGQFEQKRGDGAWLLIHEQKLTDGSTITISVDITDRKLAALKQQESEARFHDFARSSADRFWEMDRDLKFTNYIDTVHENDDWERKRTIGRTRWDAAGVDPDRDPHWAKHRNDLIARRAFRDFDYEIIDGSGAAVWWRISGVPVFDTKGNFTGYRGIGRDVTAMKETETERDLAIQRAADASNAKSIFLANMSHELRTPLNAIIGFSDVMQQRTFGELGHEKYSEYCGDISNSAQHLLSLINNVLDISKIEAEKLELNESEIDTGSVMDVCVSMLESQSSEKNISVNVKPISTNTRLLGDIGKLRQIILNLLGNAVKFTPENGSIELCCKVDTENRMTFSVTDNGVGISEADIKRVQEPFEIAESNSSTAQEGTGLGLPITKKFLELHGGNLALESVLGVGTTASAVFPARRTIAPL